MDMTPEQKCLLSLIGHSLYSMPFEMPCGVDLRALMREANAQAVSSIAFKSYELIPLDDELSEAVKTTLMRHTLSNVECFKNHTYLHNLMQNNGVRYCIVKGAVSASYYPDPLSREMGDVDFYVHPDDFELACRVLKDDGFVFSNDDHPCHISMHNGRKHFELHFKPVAYSEGSVGDMILENWRDILERSSIKQDKLATYCAPSTFHHGFILLTHLQHHLFQEGIGLRHFIDWAVFVSSLSNDEFLTLFEARLKKIGLFRLAQLLCLGAVKHLGMPHSAWMGDDYETADELLNDILSGGNFGRKDRQRAFERLLICDRDSGDVKKPRIAQMFRSLNRIVDSHWKCAKKFPLLYPIGWIFFPARFFIRMLFGKRKLNVIDTYKKSGERKKKYSKIKAYDPEE